LKIGKAVANRDLVLAMLSTATLPLDDDELSRLTGISPRQTINQVCRRLSAEGLVNREAGPDGRIVNTITRTASGAVVDSDRSCSAVVSAGSTHEQRAAESVMLGILGDALGVILSSRRIDHSSGARVEVDGANADLTILVECWAHQGPAKVLRNTSSSMTPPSSTGSPGP